MTSDAERPERGLSADGPGAPPASSASVRADTGPADERVRIREVRLLSDNHYVLKTTTFDYRRRDGTWQTLSRETYDRGNGACVLLYDPDRGTVLLTRQFRFPAFVNGHPEPLLEVVAGLLDARDPETAIRAEAEEEAGCRVSGLERVFEAFMSPGSVTERLAFFVARYSAADRLGAGGGLVEEGEDIEVVELAFDAALAMVGRGAIVDAKTILLLQHAALNGLLSRA